MLGDLGAEVIKVEPPGKGDVLRQWGHADVTGDSLWWSVAGRNKRSITVDLRTPDGQQLVRDLVAQADILVENFRPGHPRGLGAGLGGPLRGPPRADHGADQRVRADRARTRAVRATRRSARRWAACGRSPATPTCRRSGSGISIGDSLTGIFGALGAVAALEARHRTGRGQVVDASIFESVLGGDRVAGRGVVRARAPSASAPARRCPGSPRATSTRPATGQLLIAANQDSVFARLVDVMGMPELATDPRFVGPPRPWPQHGTRSTRSSRAGPSGSARPSCSTSCTRPGCPRALVYEPKDMLADPHFTARPLDRDRQGRAARRADDAGGRPAAVGDPRRRSAGRASRSAPRPTRCSPACSGSRRRWELREDGVIGRRAGGRAPVSERSE